MQREWRSFPLRSALPSALAEDRRRNEGGRRDERAAGNEAAAAHIHSTYMIMQVLLLLLVLLLPGDILGLLLLPEGCGGGRVVEIKCIHNLRIPSANTEEEGSVLPLSRPQPRCMQALPPTFTRTTCAAPPPSPSSPRSLCARACASVDGCSQSLLEQPTPLFSSTTEAAAAAIAMVSAVAAWR